MISNPLATVTKFGCCFASCDYLILGLQSGYSRLALALSAASRGYVPPYVSMDYPWMPRFGMSGPRPPWVEWWKTDTGVP